MKKQEMLELLDRFPEEIDPETLMYELYLQVKLERAEQAVAEGKVVDHQEVIQRSKGWSK
jgi:hypothetical protein